MLCYFGCVCCCAHWFVDKRDLMTDEPKVRWHNNPLLIFVIAYLLAVFAVGSGVFLVAMVSRMLQHAG